MSEQNIVELEPPRRNGRTEPQPYKAELREIMSNELLIFVSATAETVLRGIEMKQKRRERFIIALIACTLAAAIGMTRLAIQLVQSW